MGFVKILYRKQRILSKKVVRKVVK